MAVRRLLLFLMAAGLLVAVATLPYRGWQEAGERQVEFAVSLADARSFSAQHIYPLADVLAAYRQAGITTAAIGEKTLSDLTSQGQVGYPETYRVDLAILSGLEVADDTRQAATAADIDPDLNTVYIFVRDNPALAAWLESQLTIRLGEGRVGRLPGPRLGASATTEVVTALAEKNWLLATPLSIFPPDVDTVRAAGLTPVFSFRQIRGMSTAEPVRLLESLPDGAQRILFTGDAVPGWPVDSESLAGALRVRGDTLILDYRRSGQTGQTVRVAGIERMLQAVGQRAIKAYRPWVGERLEDWVTAVKDRGMRFMLFPVEVLSKNPEADLNKQVGLVRQLQAHLGPFGFTVGPVAAPVPVAVPKWGLFGAVAAVAAGAAWIALAVGGTTLALAVLVLVAGGSLAALFASDLNARQLIALGGALIYPVIGGLWALDVRRRGWQGMVETALRAVAPAFAGGLLVQAILSETAFALEMQLFKGVKAALVLPVILLLVVMAVRARREAFSMAAQAFQAPVRAGHLLLLGGALAAGVVLLIRSTNQMDPTATAVQPSDLELWFRANLEQLLVARPRFKEFLFGYPMLALGAAALQAGYERWAQVLLAVGLVAATSVVNSFAHLHHPLYLSILRGLHGLWLGLLIGGAVYLLARRLISPAPGRDRHV